MISIKGNKGCWRMLEKKNDSLESMALTQEKKKKERLNKESKRKDGTCRTTKMRGCSIEVKKHQDEKRKRKGS